jgi:heme/copper-type cytochrome/quinol oxidase subunit 4
VLPSNKTRKHRNMHRKARDGRVVVFWLCSLLLLVVLSFRALWGVRRKTQLQLNIFLPFVFFCLLIQHVALARSQ